MMQQKATSTLALASDGELVILATLGSVPAFDALVLRYRGALTHAAQAIVRSRALAEEVVQEAFLLAFDALPRLTDPEKVGGWLRAITRNRALRVYEAASRQPLPLDANKTALLAASDAFSNPEALWLTRIEEQVVVEALQKLPEADREVIYLYAYEDWSCAQIADYLQIPDATVRGRLFRARQRLRGYLQKNEEP